MSSNSTSKPIIVSLKRCLIILTPICFIHLPKPAANMSLCVGTDGASVMLGADGGVVRKLHDVSAFNWLALLQSSPRIDSAWRYQIIWQSRPYQDILWQLVRIVELVSQCTTETSQMCQWSWKRCAENWACIRCDICRHTYHQKCTPTSVKVFNEFVANANITGWVCDD